MNTGVHYGIDHINWSLMDGTHTVDYHLTNSVTPDSHGTVKLTHVADSYMLRIATGIDAGRRPLDHETAREAIYMAIGQASMCWGETPTGVFDPERAAQIALELCRTLGIEVTS